MARRTQVVVVGGGVIGSFVAYLVARQGSEVIVVDPHPGSGASSGNAGMLVPSYCMPMSNPKQLLAGLREMAKPGGAVSFEHPISVDTIRWMSNFAWESRPGRASRDAAVICEMANRSGDLYKAFAEAEQQDIGIRDAGWLHVIREERLFRSACLSAEKLSRWGVRSRVLSAREALDLEPCLSKSISGAVFFPDDAALDPGRTCAALLSAARRHGAELLVGTVLATESHRDGSVLVSTSAGSLQADAVVIAAGSLTSDLARRCGIRIPRIEPGYGWSLVLPTEELLASTPLFSVDDHTVINTTADSVRITGGMRFGGRNQPPPAPAFSALRTAAEHLVPRIRHIEASGSQWFGARPMTASGLPIVKTFNGNHIVAAGHGTLGMTLAPTTAITVVRELEKSILRSVK